MVIKHLQWCVLPALDEQYRTYTHLGYWRSECLGTRLQIYCSWQLVKFASGKGYDIAHDKPRSGELSEYWWKSSSQDLTSEFWSWTTSAKALPKTARTKPGQSVTRLWICHIKVEASRLYPSICSLSHKHWKRVFCCTIPSLPMCGHGQRKGMLGACISGWGGGITMAPAATAACWEEDRTKAVLRRASGNRAW